MIITEILGSQRVQKRFGIVYMTIFTLVWGTTIVTCPNKSWESGGFVLMIMLFILNAYLLVVVIFINLEVIKRLLPSYIIANSLLLFPSMLYNCIHEYNESMLLAVVNMISIAIIYPNRRAVYWAIFIVFQVIAAIVVGAVWGEKALVMFGSDKNSLHWVLGNNYTVNLIFIVLIAGVNIYFHYRYYAMRRKEIFESVKKNESRSDELQFQLYEQIIRYFDEQKPYLDPTFSINRFANELSTNANYVSQAIKVNKKLNFNSFVNMYRVKRAIELMQEDKGKQYTLQYIFSESGFQSQSTFNRVFKQTTGFTPSDYLAKEVVMN